MKRRLKNADVVKIIAIALVLLLAVDRAFFHHAPLISKKARVTVFVPPPMKETINLKNPAVKIVAPPVVLPVQGNATATGRPKIVIIIDDMGVDRVHSREVTTLHGPLTLSYMSYPPHIADEVADGRAAGDEIMMHIPMEPIDKKLEAGATDWFLNTGQPEAQFNATLSRNLDAFNGYVGINNHMGSRLTQDRRSMDMVMAALHDRGLLFVDSRTIASSVAAKAAKAHQVPQVSRDVFLDDVETVAAVKKQLAEVEHVAREKGQAVAIGHPKAVTITALREWLPTLKDKGFDLVTVSTAVQSAH